MDSSTSFALSDKVPFFPSVCPAPTRLWFDYNGRIVNLWGSNTHKITLIISQVILSF